MARKTFDVGKAAEYAGVSRQAVWSWIRDGLLPAWRKGHYHYVTKTDMDRWLKKREARDAQTRRNVIARASQTLEIMK